MAGHLWLRARLEMYFKEGQKPYDPTEQKKVLQLVPWLAPRVTSEVVPKRKPYGEGDWFAVPLEAGYVLGRIARVGKRGDVLLGYFFKPAIPTVPVIDHTRGLIATDSFYICFFGDRGLTEDAWPILHYEGEWKRNGWPMPAFGRIYDFNPRLGFVTRYDESELTKSIGETRVPSDEALRLPQDGIAGHLWLQKVLENYFRDGPKPFDPSEQRKGHFWFHGLPRE